MNNLVLSMPMRMSVFLNKRDTKIERMVHVFGDISDECVL